MVVVVGVNVERSYGYGHDLGTDCRQCNNVKTANKPFKKLAKLRYLVNDADRPNGTSEEIRKRLNSDIAFGEVLPSARYGISCLSFAI
jgi:hypothetical protein